MPMIDHQKLSIIKNYWFQKLKIDEDVHWNLKLSLSTPAFNSLFGLLCTIAIVLIDGRLATIHLCIPVIFSWKVSLIVLMRCIVLSYPVYCKIKHVLDHHNLLQMIRIISRFSVFGGLLLSNVYSINLLEYLMINMVNIILVVYENCSIFRCFNWIDVEKKCLQSSTLSYLLFKLRSFPFVLAVVDNVQKLNKLSIA